MQVTCRVQKSITENAQDPVREQGATQNVSGEGRGDKWASRSTRKAQSSMGHFPSLPTELPNTYFERMADGGGLWARAQSRCVGTARTEAASSFLTVIGETTMPYLGCKNVF